MKYIIDGHYDILMDVAARRKKGERQVIRRRYYPAFQKGGVTGIVASIFVDSQYLPYGALSVAMEQISALHCEIEETPDLLMLCTSADDFLRAFSPLREQSPFPPASCSTAFMPQASVDWAWPGAAEMLRLTAATFLAA